MYRLRRARNRHVSRSVEGLTATLLDGICNANDVFAPNSKAGTEKEPVNSA